MGLAVSWSIAFRPFEPISLVPQSPLMQGRRLAVRAALTSSLGGDAASQLGTTAVSGRGRQLRADRLGVRINDYGSPTIGLHVIKDVT